MAAVNEFVGNVKLRIFVMNKKIKKAYRWSTFAEVPVDVEGPNNWSECEE